jgi:hypothetical protein
MRNFYQPTISDGALAHVAGIRSLDTAGCDQPNITDAAAANPALAAPAHARVARVLEPQAAVSGGVYAGSRISCTPCQRHECIVCV